MANATLEVEINFILFLERLLDLKVGDQET